MKTQLEQLKQELREFIELSKTITPGKWAFDPDNRGGGTYPHYGIIDEETGASIPVHILTNELKAPANATFIARSRNISPAMAECLLVAVNGLDRLYDDTEGCADGAPDAADHDKLCNEVAHAAKFHLQQILIVWEAAK